MANRSPGSINQTSDSPVRNDLRPLPVLVILAMIGLAAGAAWYHHTMSDALTPAAARGDVASVRWILRWRIDPSRQDASGEAPLSAAIRGRHFDIAEMLLHAGANPNGKIYRGSDALLTESISQGQFALAYQLISHGAAIDPKTGDSPLATAVAASGSSHVSEALQMVKFLLEHGAEPNPISGPAPLLVAARIGSSDLIPVLVSHGARADNGESGNRALIAAALGGSASCWNELWKLGARPIADDGGWARVWEKRCLDPAWTSRLQGAGIAIDAGAGERTSTALMLSVGDPARVRALLQLHANPEVHTAVGETVLMACGFSGSRDTAAMLISHGSQINERDSAGTSSLLAAAAAGNSNMVEALLSLGADPNISNNLGESCLLNAARQGSMKMAETLISHGANTNATENAHRWTPMMLAVQNGHSNLIPLLLKHGAKVNARDAAGETALFIAARRPEDDSTDYLLKAGADRTIASNKGVTPLQEAVRLRHDKVAALLK